VNQVLVQEDGKFIVVGEFTSGPALRLSATGAIDASFALRGVTGFPGGSGGARFTMADDGSLYLHNTLVSLDYGAPRGLVRFKGAAVAPFITHQPFGGTLTIGQPVLLTVRAGGTAPYTYQWRKNGTNIPGANDSVYAIAAAAATDAGSYDVIVTGPAGSVTSGAAALNDSTTVTINDQPASRRAVSGSKVLFRVSATTTISGATLTYQWRKNGVNIAAATASDYMLASVGPTDDAS
jgi:hypothetical protein